MKLTRRNFIILASIFMGGVSSKSMSVTRLMSDENSDVIEVGKCFIKKYPRERENKILNSCLNFNTPSNISYIQNLRGCVEKDFENGRVVLLNGWLLSLSECRIAAYFYLNHNGSYKC